MNTLLIYPEFPDTFWSFRHALKFIRKKASLPPLGLLTVAAMLPPNASSAYCGTIRPLASCVMPTQATKSQKTVRANTDSTWAR